MISVLEVVRTRLALLGIVDDEWPCFIGYTPPEARDQLISLTDTGGFAQDTHGRENALPTFQVRVRAAPNRYPICKAKWDAVFAALNDPDLAIEGIYQLHPLASHPLTYPDDKNRPNMTLNLRAVVSAL